MTLDDVIRATMREVARTLREEAVKDKGGIFEAGLRRGAELLEERAKRLRTPGTASTAAHVAPKKGRKK